MIGAIIGGCIGGVLGSYLTEGSSSSKTTTNTYVHCHQNELIEYHKYLERKRSDEQLYDNEEIDKIYRNLTTHCPCCGKEIEFKKEIMHEADSFDDTVRVTVSCDCKWFSERFHIPQCDYRFSQDTEKTINKIGDVVRFFYEKITDKIDKEKIREEYMERKLKEKEYVEKYYGKI